LAGAWGPEKLMAKDDMVSCLGVFDNVTNFLQKPFNFIPGSLYPSKFFQGDFLPKSPIDRLL